MAKDIFINTWKIRVHLEDEYFHSNTWSKEEIEDCKHAFIMAISTLYYDLGLIPKKDEWIHPIDADQFEIGIIKAVVYYSHKREIKFDIE